MLEGEFPRSCNALQSKKKTNKIKKQKQNLIHYPSQRIATRDEQMHKETGSSNPVYQYVSIVYTSHVTFTLNRSVQFSSVQFKMVSMRSEKPYALHPVSQIKFPQRCLSNSSSVRLSDDGPPSSFQRRSSSASSFHASLLQAIDGVMSSALCLQVVSQTGKE